MSKIDDVNNLSFYKWNLFYFNKNDKRVFPPKPNNQVGFQINFGNIKSVFAFLLGLSFFGFILFIISSK